MTPSPNNNQTPEKKILAKRFFILGKIKEAYLATKGREYKAHTHAGETILIKGTYIWPLEWAKDAFAPDMEYWRDIISDLSREGIIEIKHEMQSASGQRGLFLKVDPEKLEKLYTDLKKIVLTEEGRDPSKIYSLVFKIDNEKASSYELVINGRDHKKILKKSRDKSWPRLYKIAEKKSLSLDSKEDARRLKDYLNSNKGCPLYADRKYLPSHIIDRKQTNVFPAQEIELHVASAREWTILKKMLRT